MPIKGILIVAKGKAVIMIDTVYNFTALEILEKGSNYGAVASLNDEERMTRHQLVAHTNITVYFLKSNDLKKCLCNNRSLDNAITKTLSYYGKHGIPKCDFVTLKKTDRERTRVKRNFIRL